MTPCCLDSFLCRFKGYNVGCYYMIASPCESDACCCPNATTTSACNEYHGFFHRLRVFDEINGKDVMCERLVKYLRVIAAIRIPQVKYSAL